MCGILGIASTVSIERRDWLSAGSDSMRHRGPDAKGLWWSDSGNVGFAHRRLSILDLSDAGSQPMRYEAADLTITFNGEIYNHKAIRSELVQRGVTFRSGSDTEVLLAAYSAWGEGFLDRINGMFALALYDGVRNLLLLARDRAGEKPLFYHCANRTLRFGSELKSLMADPTIERKIDHTALECYLGAGFVPGGMCILDGVRKLPPAHRLIFDLATGAVQLRRFWDIPLQHAHITGDDKELVGRLEDLLENAVGSQLVADVPVGVLLSGGLDSSLITALAARCSPKVRTFTIRFPGYGSLDETEHARLVANHFGTEHLELAVEASSADLMPDLARQFDEPINDSSMIPTWLLTRAVREHCKVALGGDGGDELFGGYRHYPRLLWLAARSGQVPRWARTLIASAMAFLPEGVKGRNYLRALGTNFNTELPHLACYFDRRARYRLLSGRAIQQPEVSEILASRVPPASDLLDRATRMDFTTYLAEDLLVKVDRASMHNSVEIRSPMLDRNVLEFAFGQVPMRLKATSGGARKILLRQLAQRILPPDFDRTRKQGFSIPLAVWLRRGPFRDLFYDVLESRDCIFDRSMTARLLRNQDCGLNNTERLFGLVMFELWRKAYCATLA